MKSFAVLLILVAITANEISAKIENPCDKEETKCHMTDNKSYLKCLEKKRVKRSLCPGASAVINPYAVACNTPNCVNNAVLDNCINTCSGSCNGYNCQDRCDKSCSNQKVISVQSTPTIAVPQKEVGAPTIISPNVTTTIHLTNIVNNTNHINVPTSINNTNINNLDLNNNSSAVQQMLGGSQHKCCIVVQPKVCHNLNGTSGGKRCVHKRHHTCGPQCESATMHAQVRQPCEGTPEECPPSIAYVPQPQPRCTYTSAWPYVSCGANVGQGMPNCEGCYDHYGYGFQNFHPGLAPDCQGCYDDGFGEGSMYRQGPYYRPGYYHAPPVEMAAYSAPVACGAGGCFGNQMIDPAFGMTSCSPYAGGCAPSSQYYIMMENYAPAVPQPMYAPPFAQQYYAPPQQYYQPMPQVYSSPQQYYPSYQQPFYDPNVQFYGQQEPYYPETDDSSFLYNFDNNFNETASKDLWTESNNETLEQPCCIIIDPHKCSQRSDKKWECNEKQHHVCGAPCMYDYTPQIPLNVEPNPFLRQGRVLMPVPQLYREPPVYMLQPPAQIVVQPQPSYNLFPQDCQYQEQWPFVNCPNTYDNGCQFPEQWPSVNCPTNYGDIFNSAPAIV